MLVRGFDKDGNLSYAVRGAEMPAISSYGNAETEAYNGERWYDVVHHDSGPFLGCLEFIRTAG